MDRVKYFDPMHKVFKSKSSSNLGNDRVIGGGSAQKLLQKSKTCDGPLGIHTLSKCEPRLGLLKSFVSLSIRKGLAMNQGCSGSHCNVQI